MRTPLLLALMILATPWVLAESSLGSQRARAHLDFRITVPPIFRILQSTPVEGGHELRIWTNLPTVRLNGREYRIARLGESTLRVPTAREALIVHGL